MAAATLVGLVLCLGAGAIQLAQSASVHFVDSPTTQYLKAQTAEQQLNAPELRATLKSLLSFQTIGSLSRASAAKVPMIRPKNLLLDTAVVFSGYGLTLCFSGRYLATRRCLCSSEHRAGLANSWSWPG